MAASDETRRATRRESFVGEEVRRQGAVVDSGMRIDEARASSPRSPSALRARGPRTVRARAALRPPVRSAATRRRRCPGRRRRRGSTHSERWARRSASREPARRSDRRRDLPFVQGRRPARLDPAKRGGRGREARSALRVGGSATGRVAACDHLWAMRALQARPDLRKLGSRADRLIEPEPAEPGRKVVPQAHGTRHGDGARALVVRRRAVAEIGGGTARPVEPVEHAVVPDERERVSSDPVVRGLRDRQDRGSSERCVDCVAAALEGTQARARGDAGDSSPPSPRSRSQASGATRSNARVRPRREHRRRCARGEHCTIYTLACGRCRRPSVRRRGDETSRCVERGGGYEVVHSSPGLEIGVYVLVAPEPDRQQPHDEDEVYVVLEGSGVLEVEGTATPSRRAWPSSSRQAPSIASRRMSNSRSWSCSTARTPANRHVLPCSRRREGCTFGSRDGGVARVDLQACSHAALR